MFRALVLMSFAAVVAGCGKKDLCAQKLCETPLICDPEDGQCKCGGHGGVVCPENFTCDSAANTCQSLRCKGVDCSMKEHTSCDVIDAICKCGGTGGKVCAADELCNADTKRCEPPISCLDRACPANQTCDGADGKCKCGLATCATGQFCSVTGTNANDRVCVDDICNGVKCAGSTRCDQTDGYCKCNGLVCQSGEACSCGTFTDGGSCTDGERSCKPGSACLGVDCNMGRSGTCDPVDGKCKCGGPGGDTCGADQVCSLGPPAHCQGGAQCTRPDGGPKVCTGGTGCDPEDGKCKCGGASGELCLGANDAGVVAAQICISTGQQRACRDPCDTRSPNCPSGKQCYYDSSAATPAAYCATATGMSALEDACTVPTACFATPPGAASPVGLHCNGLAQGTTGVCRSYCDATLGNCPTLVAQTCVQITGATPGVGYCQPL